MSVMQATVGDRQTINVKYDYLLIIATVALLGLGMVMVASSSLHKISSAPFYYLIRHLIAVGIGLVGMLVMTRIPMREWERWSTTLFFMGVFMLALVLVPGIGREANGATRWIPLGSFNLQSSEFPHIAVYDQPVGDGGGRGEDGIVGALGYQVPRQEDRYQGRGSGTPPVQRGLDDRSV